MSYKIEIMDEYSFFKWFSSDDLRFETKGESEEYSRHHFKCWGWNGILDLRTVASDEKVNACWTANRVLRMD